MKFSLLFTPGFKLRFFFAFVKNKSNSFLQMSSTLCLFASLTTLVGKMQLETITAMSQPKQCLSLQVAETSSVHACAWLVTVTNTFFFLLLAINTCLFPHSCNGFVTLKCCDCSIMVTTWQNSWMFNWSSTSKFKCKKRCLRQYFWRKWLHSKNMLITSKMGLKITIETLFFNQHILIPNKKRF